MAKRPSQRILEALADLAKAFQRIDTPSMVIGGIAVIAHGVLGAPERIPEFERLLPKVLGPDA